MKLTFISGAAFAAVTLTAAQASADRGISSTTTVQSADTATLAADLFAPPAGYKVNPKT